MPSDNLDASLADAVSHQLLHYNPPPDGHWQPVYADEHVLVVDKPAGLLTVPGRGEHVQDCLIHRVQQRYPDARIVHRLDMDTSGLVVLGLGAQMQKALSGLFMHRQVDKQYEALVHGCPVPGEGLVDLPLMTDWPRRPRQMVDHTIGKPSQTAYRVMPDAALPIAYARLALTPLTGRSHQLRVHCQALGHPIVGDRLYGPVICDEAIARAGRLMLHATHLAFLHPVKGDRLSLRLPCPF
jgi:tRNA pseudouridine32 synthase/23S rRNA pseudouridine746 synthase